jgi:polyisoprenyl-phosphate glycosyltransferase
MSKSSLISIVIPCFNEEKYIANTIERIISCVKSLNYHFELIIVDDGSIDNTELKISDLSKQDIQSNISIKGVILSRNYGHQKALEAGLQYAEGAAVISIDADLEQPPELIPELLLLWEQGSDIVITIRDDGKETSFFKRITSKYFYWIYNIFTGIKIKSGAADYRLMDKKLVDIFVSMQEGGKFFRGLIEWVGFKKSFLNYKPSSNPERISRYTLKKMVNFAVNGIVSFSTRPLYISLILGTITLLFSIIYAIVIFLLYSFGNTNPGQSSILITIIFFSGIIMLLQGIQGLYIAQISREVKKRPNFIVSTTYGCSENSGNN